MDERNRHLAELYANAHHFVDQVSGQIGKPLAVIREFTAILAEGLAGPLSAEQSEYLGIVVEQVEELHRRLRDMLDMRRLEAGMIRAVRRPCSLNAIIVDAQRVLARRAAMQQTTLVIELPEPLPRVYGDPEMIGRLIVNLGMHALDGLRHGRRLELRVRLTPSGHQVGLALIAGIDDAAVARGHDGWPMTASDDPEWATVPHDDGEEDGLGVEVARQLALLNFGEVVFTVGRRGVAVPVVRLALFEPETLPREYLKSTSKLKRRSSHVSLIEALVEGQVDSLHAARIDDFLQHLLRSGDWVFQAVPGAWLLSVAGAAEDLDIVVGRIEEAWAGTGRGDSPEDWPQVRLRVVGTWPISDSGNGFGAAFLREAQRLASADAREVVERAANEAGSSKLFHQSGGDEEIG